MDGEFYRPKRLVEELKDMLLAPYRAAGLVSRQERNGDERFTREQSRARQSALADGSRSMLEPVAIARKAAAGTANYPAPLGFGGEFPALLPCGHTTRDHGSYQMALYLCLCVMLDYDPEPLHSWATVEREIEWMRREAKKYGLLCEGVQNDPQPKPVESLTSAAISKALEHEREVAGGCFRDFDDDNQDERYFAEMADMEGGE